MAPWDDQKERKKARRFCIYLVCWNAYLLIQWLGEFGMWSDPSWILSVWQVCYLAGLAAAGLNFERTQPNSRGIWAAVILIAVDAPIAIAIVASTSTYFGFDDPASYVFLAFFWGIPLKIYLIILFSKLARHHSRLARELSEA